MTGPLDEVALRDRFHLRLGALYAAAVFGVLVLASVAFYRVAVDGEREGLQARLRLAAVALAASIDGDHLDEDRVALEARLDRVLEESPDISSAYVLAATDDPGRFVFVVDRSRGSQGAPGAPFDATALPVLRQGLSAPAVEEHVFVDNDGTASLSGYAPVRDAAGRGVAVVGLDVSDERLRRMERRVFGVVAMVFALAAALLVAIGALLARNVKGPLGRAVDAAAAVARGDLDARAGIERRDEFGVLGRQLDRMAQGLAERERIRETFGYYLSPEVAAVVLARRDAVALGGEERDVSVLFCDLRSYSTISERLPPAEVVELLNAWLGTVMAQVEAHQGWVVEILGDGLLAVFGAPNPLPDHPAAAVRCAVAMREHMEKQNEVWERDGFARRWRDRGIERLEGRIGIHTGRVVAGNLGGGKRRKYSVIGDTVNVAARLEALNKELGTDVLLSDAVYAALPPEDAARAVDRGEHQVKGRDQGVRVYSL